MNIPTGRDIWRKYATAGVPASGPHSPNKTEIVQWTDFWEAMLSVGAPGLAKATLALLEADIVHAADSTAIVYADPNPANNGFYVKIGVSGYGSWSHVGDLPGSLVRLTVTGGTGNAIVATAPVTPSVPGNWLYLMTPAANCSGPSTVLVNGAAAAPIKTALASDTVTGSLVANSPVLMAWQVDHYQLMISLPVDATGVLNDVLAARSDAQTAAAAAAGSAAALANQAYTFDTGTQAAAATIPTALANIRVIRDQAGDPVANQIYVPGIVSDPGAFAEAGGHYWKPDLSGPPVRSLFSSRASLAASKVPALLNVAVCFGYAAVGDCSPFMFKRVTSQPAYGGVRSTDRYLPDGTVSSGNGGWWVYVPGSEGVDARAFGYVADWNGTDTGVTDNATALQNAINFSTLLFGTGFDTGGGGGNDVVLPSGTAMIGSPIIVHDGVRVLGKGTYATVLKMKNTFSASEHFFRLGTPGDAVAVAASQTKASAGDLIINGTLASGGVATFLQKRVISVYSAGNDSARTFTVYGTAGGVSINQSVTGANAGKVDTAGYFDTVTRVAVNGATASTVTVGFETRAAFGSRLEKMQLFATTTNAALGKSMVYSNNAQHTAGVKDIKVFGGNRHCVVFETGIGGASYFTCDDVETFNHGNTVGVASNNSQIKLNYAGLLTNIRNIVMGGPGPSGGAAARGLEILGGNVIGENIHAEGISDGIVISIPTENEGTVQLRNVNGNPFTTNLIHIDSVTDNNTVVVSSIFGNGSTVTIKDDPGAASVTGNIIPWTTY